MTPVLLNCSALPWRRARKVRPVRAKHMSAVMSDAGLATKLLLQTLEALEPLDSSSMFCLGVADDAWMQSSAKLLAKYSVVAIDAQGWLVCEPKPENEALCVCLTPEVLAQACYDQALYEQGTGFVQSQRGETIAGLPNLQRFEAGDYLLGALNDAADRWIVRSALWESTYAWLPTPAA